MASGCDERRVDQSTEDHLRDSEALKSTQELAEAEARGKVSPWDSAEHLEVGEKYLNC